MSRAMRDQGAAIPHLSKGEIADLRGDVDGAFDVIEGRPQIHKVTGGIGLSLGAVATGLSADLGGANFLMGQATAELAIGTGTAILTFKANRPGTPGNDLSVEIVDVGAGGTATVAVAAGKVTIDKEGGTDDAAAIKVILDADADFAALMTVADDGAGGAGEPAVAAEANLAGGTGEGFKVYANGIEQPVDGEVTDTACPLVVDDLTGALANDTTTIVVESDGLKSAPVSVDVIA